MSGRSRLGVALLSLAAVVVVVLLAGLGPRTSLAAPPDASPDSGADPGAEIAPTEATTESEPEIELDAQGRVRVPTPSAKAMAWYRSGNLRYGLSLAWGLLIPALLLISGGAAKLRDACERLARGRAAPMLLSFLAAYALLVFVADFPLALWGDYLRPHAFGLSNQSFGKWFGDELKSLALGILALWLFVPGSLWFVRRSPERWWIWTSMVAVPIAFLILMITPVFIAPLFNDFGPMQDAGLEAEILALADRAGIEGGRVFEVDKSVDTKAVNAYVTGFWSSKRIVLWDTIIARLERDELLVVMGHEMGHYVLGHVRNSMLAALVTIPLSLWLVHILSRWVLARFGARFGIDSLADVAALPLFFVLSGLFGLVASPVANAWSRHQEHESDRFALEITHDNEACGRAFARLQQSNLGNPRPGPIFVLMRASHPPLGERIDFCNDYRPWATGEASRYEHLFLVRGESAPASTSPD